MINTHRGTSGKKQDPFVALGGPSELTETRVRAVGREPNGHQAERDAQVVREIVERFLNQSLVPTELARGLAPAPVACDPSVESYIAKHECARRLGRTVRSVDSYMEKGIIPFYKLGRTVAFKWSEVDAHIKAHYRVCLKGLRGEA